MNSFIQKLSDVLQEELPGKSAQEIMMPEGRNRYQSRTTSNSKNSSVLIPIFKIDTIYHTLLFQRQDYDGDHSGQICFPGGKKEPDDKNLQFTAIRETWEEVGIEMNKVKVLGRLTPLHIPVSNYLVYPFIGWIDNSPEFKPDPVEVKELIITPIEELMQPENKKTETMHLHNLDFQVPYFAIQNYKIWGATAMIISEWITVLQHINFQRTD